MFGMLYNYDARKVGNYEKENIRVSTAAVTDGDRPYETAIRHPEYNEGDFVVVEAYKSKREAKKGHAKWVKTITGKRLPKTLIECCNSLITKFAAKAGVEMVYKRKKIKDD